MPASMMEEQLDPLNPRARKKSKNGCRTCKLRKIKCDECIPICINCTRYYTNGTPRCEYGLNLPVVIPSTSTRNPSMSTSSSLGGAPASNQVVSRRSKASQYQERDSKKRTPLPKALAMQRLDPFNTRQRNPDSAYPSADMLLHHYLTTTRQKCLPYGFKPEDNPLAIQLGKFLQQSHFLNHVALQIAAHDLEWASGAPNKYSSNVYKVENFCLLRKALGDPVEGISDLTIAAVAMLAVIEHGKRNMTAAKMHVDGLKRMVSLRGGLEQVRASSAITACSVFWFTFVIMSEPQFPIMEGEDLRYKDSDLRTYPHPIPSTAIRFQDFVYDEASVEILIASRAFCYNLNVLAKDHSILIPGMEDGIHSTNGWLHLRLLQKAPPGRPRPALTDCLRFATSIFFFFGFRNHFPDPTLLIHTLLHQLKYALIGVLPGSDRENVLVLWLLAVGGTTAARLPAERDWFIGYMIDTAFNMGINSWDGMRESLRRVMWFDAMDDEPFRKLWDDAMLIAKSQTTQDPFYVIHRLS